MYLKGGVGVISSAASVTAKFAQTGQDVSSTPLHEYGEVVSGTNAPAGLFTVPKTATDKSYWPFYVVVGLGAYYWLRRTKIWQSILQRS